MKFADRFLYTMWIIYLFMFLMWIPAVSEPLFELVWTIGGMWIVGFAFGAPVGGLMLEHLRKQKRQEVERFRFNKRFIAKLINVFSLFMCTFAANLIDLNDWHAIVGVIFAGAFSGYVYVQDIFCSLFRLIERVYGSDDDKEPENTEGFDKTVSHYLIERDTLDLSMLDRARAALTVPARLVDGD